VAGSVPGGLDSLDEVSPGDFTVRNAARLLAGADPCGAALPSPQALPEDLVAEGHTIPVARVQAMHEGKRRARAQRGPFSCRRMRPVPGRPQTRRSQPVQVRGLLVATGIAHAGGVSRQRVAARLG